jgi:Tol biopolymer transport system component
MPMSKKSPTSFLGVAGSCALTTMLMVSAAFAGSAADGRIAFVGNQGGSFQLYTVNPDGSDMVQVTTLPPTLFETWVPDFSPDGRRLTFCYGTFDDFGNLFTEIYVINIDGTGLKQLTKDGLIDCFPRWSPDGSTIIFGREVPRTQQLVVTTMRADGSDKRGLSSPLWGIARSGFTPDGMRILWETQQAGFISVLWIMDADGTNQKRLTSAPLKAGEVSAPSPDGKHVVFTNNQNTPPELPNALFVLDIGSGTITQITQPVGVSHDLLPNYSPDGTKIVFASDRMSTDGSLDLFTINADGSGLTRIATGITVGGCPDKNCVSPAWGLRYHFPPLAEEAGTNGEKLGFPKDERAEACAAAGGSDNGGVGSQMGSLSELSSKVKYVLNGNCFHGNTATAVCTQTSDAAQCPRGRRAVSPTFVSCYFPHSTNVDTSSRCSVKGHPGYCATMFVGEPVRQP